uniref:Uncharacterized protein n=1 Tax=Anguilla anguilla TaxID=7936 RepID=A0A0E9XI09_ANGAN
MQCNHLFSFRFSVQLASFLPFTKPLMPHLHKTLQQGRQYGFFRDGQTQFSS